MVKGRALLAASVALVLLSCGGPEPAPKTAEPAATPAPTVVKPPAAESSAKPPSSAAPVAAGKLHVIDAGAAPRSLRTYVFTVNQVDKRVVTLVQEQHRPGRTIAPLTVSMHIDFTPRKVEASGTRFELKVKKLEMAQQGVTPAEKAEIGKALAVFEGLTGAFDVSPQGKIGEVSMPSDSKMQDPLAEGIVNALSQTTELLVPMFPEEPIGLGARWEWNDEIGHPDRRSSRKATHTLKEVDAEGGVVDVAIEIEVPTRTVGGRGVPARTTVSAEGSGNYSYRFRFDRLATSVKGELAIKQHIEAVDGTGKTQAVDDTQLAKHTIDTRK